MSARAAEAEELEHQRWELLRRIEHWLEAPMLLLGFAWLVLLGIELLRPELWRRNPLLDVLSTAIWIVFLLNFLIELTLAPQKKVYFKTNWLTALSLALPALRIFRAARVVRLFRAARAARGLRLLKVVSSLNRGMRALGASMSRRGFAYVLALTLLVTVVGAAGMFAFENEVADGLHTYGEALWWTAMIMTTMGSAYWPQTAEGRVLCVALALYAFGVFGYVTAALATFFVGRDAEAGGTEIAGARAIEHLEKEIAALRAAVQEFTRDRPQG